MLSKLSTLRQLARREARLQLLQQICPDDLDDLSNDRLKEVRSRFDPVFWQMYAQELGVDSRENSRCIELLRKAIRCMPMDAVNYWMLGNIAWDQRRFECALELYRTSACLDAADERFARAYFGAARSLKQERAAVASLQKRFDRSLTKSTAPARTLHWVLNSLDQQGAAFEVLEKALAARPEDGEFALYAAEYYGAYGRHERASEFVESARKIAERNWLYTATALARYRGDMQVALERARKSVESDPLRAEVHRSYVRLLSEVHGRDAVCKHLDQYCAFPVLIPAAPALRRMAARR